MLTADTADQAPSPALTLQQLRNATELLEREVIARGRGTDDDLNARRPGSAQYPDTSPDAWLGYVIWLSERNGVAGRGDRLSANGRPVSQVLHEALADTPVRVELADGSEIRVHPKSLDALLILEALDADMQSVLADLHTVLAVEASEPFTSEEDNYERYRATARFAGALLKSKTLRFFVWILSHPGSGLPFDESVEDPELPEWTATLRAVDLERIVIAHLDVNRRDIEFLMAAFPSENPTAQSRLPMSGFLGAYASEHGLEARVVMRERTLRSVIASAVVAAQAAREARPVRPPE